MRKDPIPPAVIRGKIYHKPKGQPYAYGCNAETIRDVSRSKRDYEGIDLDLRINGQGVGFVCHQAYPTKRDAWFDPAGRINDRTPIGSLTSAECRRLRVRYQGKLLPMLSARSAGILCRNATPRRLIPMFEAKGQDPRFYSVEWWEAFHRQANVAHFIPVIMSLPGSRGAGARKLKAAGEAGLVTCWLWRKGHAIPDHVDLVKSHPGKGGIYRLR